MKRLAIGLLSVVALAIPVPAAADPPVEEPILDVFTDINPCTGEEMTVTFVGTALVHEHGEREIATAHRTITTSDGFEGRGMDSFVDNGQVVGPRWPTSSPTRRPGSASGQLPVRGRPSNGHR